MICSPEPYLVLRNNFPCIGPPIIEANNMSADLRAIHCGALIAFCAGADDAEQLARQFGGDAKPANLAGLANGELSINLMLRGVRTKAFSARTFPPSSLIPVAA
jgi:hypothetical protein